MSLPLRVAVIGVGAMGRNHARIYADLPGVQLVAIADTDIESLQSVARRHSCSAYTNYKQLLDEQELDAVSVVVPTVHHLEVAQCVIAHGIHLLIEKPIARSVDEGQQIIDAAKRSGVRLAIGHVERFNPAVIALKEHILRGELGSIFQLDARRQGPFPTRVYDVGVVIDLAVHDLDVMRYVSGAEIVRIYAEIERRIHRTHEDMLTCLLRLDNGVVGTLNINWLTPTKIRELCVIGERGMYRVDYLTQDLYFYENAGIVDSNWEALQVLRGVSEGRMIRHVVNKKEPLRAELEAFTAAVRGESSVAVTGEDGLRALQLAHAILGSGQERRPFAV